MTEAGWIIVVVVAVVAIILAVVLIRRKTAGDILPSVPAVDAPLHERVMTPVDTPQPVEETSFPQGPLATTLPPIAATLSPTQGDTAPVAEQDVSAEPVASDGDDLLRLKGVGPKIADLLKAHGITRYAQVAAWSDADIAAIDAKLGSFAGRPKRDNWVDQARLLSAGDVLAYEAKYGKL